MSPRLAELPPLLSPRLVSPNFVAPDPSNGPWAARLHHFCVHFEHKLAELHARMELSEKRSRGWIMAERQERIDAPLASVTEVKMMRLEEKMDAIPACVTQLQKLAGLRDVLELQVSSVAELRVKVEKLGRQVEQLRASTALTKVESLKQQVEYIREADFGGLCPDLDSVCRQVEFLGEKCSEAKAPRSFIVPGQTHSDARSEAVTSKSPRGILADHNLSLATKVEWLPREQVD